MGFNSGGFDAAPLLECFGMHPDLVFDVGAHSGNDTAYYLSRGFRVVAVEAHPIFAAALYVRFRDAYVAGKLHVLNLAVADRPGLCALLESQQESQWSTILPEVAASKSGEFREVVVPAMTFDHVFERFGTPHYLKVDIEGAELSVFRHLKDRPQFISFETGEDVFTIIHLLRDLGYPRFKLVNQRLIHEKMASSSGPFGDETPGPWLGGDEIEEQIGAMQQPGAIRPDDWFDVHVAL